MITTFVKFDFLRNFELASLLKVTTAGSKINKDIFETFMKALPHVEVYKSYGILFNIPYNIEYFVTESRGCKNFNFFFFDLKGMTEGGGITTLQNDKRQSNDSVGFVTPNVKVKIVDLENGKALGPNKEGELCVKSNNFMTGYYKNPQATAEAIDEDG